MLRICLIAALGLPAAGCIAPPYGYWDARLAQLPVPYNYGCRDAQARSNREDAVLYCPSDMPLPPAGVWRPGLAGAR
jgi:hypothetical protein